MEQTAPKWTFTLPWSVLVGFQWVFGLSQVLFLNQFISRKLVI